jgi:hypothetical protein
VIDKHIETRQRHLSLCEVRPPPSKDLAAGEAIGKIAGPDTLQKRSGGGQFTRARGAVDASGMAFQVSGKLERTIERISADIGDFTGSGVSEVINKRQRRHQLAVLG